MSNAKWINLPVFAAIRRPSIADTLSCDVDAHSSESDEVYKVVFTVTASNGQKTIIQSLSRSMRFPNFSNYNSRLPGTIPGALAPSWCFGFTLDCSAFPGGRTRIAAVVHYSNGGTRETLPDIFVLIDWDSDRRGSSKEIHFRGQTGNDSTGDGSPTNPVKSINRAISLARNTPSGSPTNSAAMNCGGAKIIGGEEIVGCGSTFSNWHTGGEWLTIEFLPGSTWKRHATQNYIGCGGVGSDTRCSIRWANMDLRGEPPIVNGDGFPTSNMQVTSWVENLTHHSKFWDPSIPWSVRHLEDIGLKFAITGVSSVVNSGKVFFTGLLSDGAAYGPTDYSGIYDFHIKNYIGIALQPTGPQQGDYAINGIIERQRSRSPDVAGFINCRGGAVFSVSQPAAGQIRITATGTTYYSDSNDNTTAIDWPNLLIDKRAVSSNR